MTLQALDVPAMLAALSAALIWGVLQPRAEGARWPLATVAMIIAIAAMVALQSAFPALLPALARTPALVQSGQLWRAFTALFVQDGGAVGTVFNLTILLLLGIVAERQLGWVRWLMIYVGAGVLTEFLALAWQPDGAGNSIACFALAGGMIAFGFGKRIDPIRLALAIVSLGAGVVLILARDIHGLGYWAGAVVATFLRISADAKVAVEERS